jgi:hypothetical protein
VPDALGEDAPDAGGNLGEAYRNTKSDKEYLEARQCARNSRSRESLEATIYNHCYTFFSRYWRDMSVSDTPSMPAGLQLRFAYLEPVFANTNISPKEKPDPK